MTAVALPRNFSAAKAWKANVLPEVVWLLRKVGVGEAEVDVLEDVDVDVLLVVELGVGEVDVGALLKQVSTLFQR